jgi:hypothetical protein
LTFKISEHCKNFCQLEAPENVSPEIPASVPHMVMSAFKGSLEEKPSFSLKGMTVRKVSSWAKVRYALALK